MGRTFFGVPRADAQIGGPLEGRVELRERLRSADAWPEPADHHQAPPDSRAVKPAVVCERAAPGRHVRAVLQRNPQVSLRSALDAPEIALCDANDRERDSAHVKRLADDGRVAGKPARPIGIAQHSNLSVLSFILRSKSAAARREHTQAEEKIPADHIALDNFRLFSITDSDAAEAERHEGHEVGENTLLVS